MTVPDKQLLAIVVLGSVGLGALITTISIAPATDTAPATNTNKENLKNKDEEELADGREVRITFACKNTHHPYLEPIVLQVGDDGLPTGEERTSKKVSNIVLVPADWEFVVEWTYRPEDLIARMVLKESDLPEKSFTKRTVDPISIPDKTRYDLLMLCNFTDMTAAASESTEFRVAFAEPQ